MTRTSLQPSPAAAPRTLNGTNRTDFRQRRGALRCALGAAALAGLTLFGGCASMNQITVDVASFGSWPVGRAPGRYAFERLLSQAQGGAAQSQLEEAARGALERAGFRAAPDAASADVLVQVGNREGRILDPWSDFNWGWRIGGWRGFGPVVPRAGGYWGWSIGGAWPSDNTRDFREVALQILDRPSRQPLIEAHVRYEARVVGDRVLPALFDAALQGFPNLPTGQRQVTVALTPPPPAPAASTPGR